MHGNMDLFLKLQHLIANKSGKNGDSKIYNINIK
jgi:hypothetical protein